MPIFNSCCAEASPAQMNNAIVSASCFTTFPPPGWSISGRRARDRARRRHRSARHRRARRRGRPAAPAPACAHRARAIAASSMRTTLQRHAPRGAASCATRCGSVAPNSSSVKPRPKRSSVERPSASQACGARPPGWLDCHVDARVVRLRRRRAVGHADRRALVAVAEVRVERIVPGLRIDCREPRAELGAQLAALGRIVVDIAAKGARGVMRSKLRIASSHWRDADRPALRVVARQQVRRRPSPRARPRASSRDRPHRRCRCSCRARRSAA